MPRPKLILSADAAYHLTARANNKNWFSLPMEEMWTIYETWLTRTAERYQFVFHAFVLMANHFHLIASTPNKNLSAGMRYLLTQVSREVGRRTDRINHIFGGRYRWSVLWGASDLAYVYKYVLRNPVRAGIHRRVEEYAFSSFSLLLQNRCGLPIVDGIDRLWHCIPREPAARARWLNHAPDSESEKLITLGLRRFEFRLPDHTEAKEFRSNLADTYGVEPVDNFEK